VKFSWFRYLRCRLIGHLWADDPGEWAHCRRCLWHGQWFGWSNRYMPNVFDYGRDEPCRYDADGWCMKCGDPVSQRYL
jgi:hypothetical protein